MTSSAAPSSTYVSARTAMSARCASLNWLIRPDVAQKEDLADPVEDVRVRREVSLGRVVRQDAMAEAVEVADREPRPRRSADGHLDPIREFAGRPDVVRQDKDLLGDERT